jgi:putative ATPase
LERQTFYAPTTYGYEAEVKARLDRWADLRAKKGGHGR